MEKSSKIGSDETTSKLLVVPEQNMPLKQFKSEVVTIPGLQVKNVIDLQAENLQQLPAMVDRLNALLKSKSLQGNNKKLQAQDLKRLAEIVDPTIKSLDHSVNLELNSYLRYLEGSIQTINKKVDIIMNAQNSNANKKTKLQDFSIDDSLSLSAHRDASMEDLRRATSYPTRSYSSMIVSKPKPIVLDLTSVQKPDKEKNGTWTPIHANRYFLDPNNRVQKTKPDPLKWKTLDDEQSRLSKKKVKPLPVPDTSLAKRSQNRTLRPQTTQVTMENFGGQMENFEISNRKTTVMYQSIPEEDAKRAKISARRTINNISGEASPLATSSHRPSEYASMRRNNTAANLQPVRKDIQQVGYNGTAGVTKSTAVIRPSASNRDSYRPRNNDSRAMLEAITYQADSGTHHHNLSMLGGKFGMVQASLAAPVHPDRGRDTADTRRKASDRFGQQRSRFTPQNAIVSGEEPTFRRKSQHIDILGQVSNRTQLGDIGTTVSRSPGSGLQRRRDMALMNRKKLQLSEQPPLSHPLWHEKKITPIK